MYALFMIGRITRTTLALAAECLVLAGACGNQVPTGKSVPPVQDLAPVPPVPAVCPPCDPCPPCEAAMAGSDAKVEAPTQPAAEVAAPDLAVLYHLTRLYEPVKFAHAAHVLSLIHI